MNTHIQSLKVWLKFILPWLNYTIFSRGLFFISTPCICSVKMSALNKHLMEFVSSHISKDASCNLMPVFDDYRSRIADISAEVDTQSVAASSASASAGEQCQFIALLANEGLLMMCSYSG